MRNNKDGDAPEEEEEDPQEGEEEQSLDEEEPEELLEQWAAGEIQAAWRKYREKRGCGGDTGGVKHTPRSSPKVTTSRAAEGGGGICCACFVPLPHAELRPNESAAACVQLFCSGCKHQLERGSRGFDGSSHVTPIASSIASPLPKLSVLVQTEAKYQDQLKLLRQQQELLKQQQQEMETRKKLQAETQQLAKQLARQRRRHFQKLMAQRRAEEAQKIQEIVGANEEPRETAKRRSKPTRERPRPSAEAAIHTVAIEPGQLRRHRIPAPPASKGGVDAASKAAELAEKAASEHRRKQKLETMKCYAQDLTPLVLGQKPKKLPVPVAAPAAVQAAKKAAQKPVKPSKIKLMPLQPPSHKDKKGQQSNNQSEQLNPQPRHYDDYDSSDELRVQIPRRSHAYAMPTPLTAEIKPASWMYELLSSDPVLREPHHHHHPHTTTASASASILGTTPSTSLLGISHSRAQLTSLMEEDDEPGDQSHSLRSSYSGSGQRVTLAPLASSSATTAATAAPPKREYTSERLASLLEKYHVSVSTTASQ